MPTYILDRSSPVRLARGPLSISVTATGSRTRLDVRGRGGDTPIIRATPHLIIVPRLTGPVVLRAVPDDGPLFGPSTSVALTVGIDGSREDDPERAQLPAVDVTGLPHSDLLSIEPRDEMLWIQVAARTYDEVLPELVSLARAATRRVLGVDRVPALHAVRMVVAIDASASGRLMASEGTVGPVVEVLLGISRVLATEAEPPRIALVAGDDLTWVHPASVGELSQATVHALVAVPGTIGFRAAHPGLRGLAPDDNVVTYIVTDGIPPDQVDLEHHDAVEGEARHLVVLGPDGAVSTADDVAIPRTHVATPGDEPLAERLRRDAYGLEAMVRQLLHGCFPPQSDLARRVSG